MDAFGCENLDERQEHLRTASQILKQESDKLFYQQTEDEIGLLAYQQNLELACPGISFVGSSLYSTLFRCIVVGYAFFDVFLIVNEAKKRRRRR